ILPFLMISSHRLKPLPRSTCNLLIQIRNPRQAQDQRQKRRQQEHRLRQKPIRHNHSNYDKEIEYNMGKIIIGLSALFFTLFTCNTALAYGHANAWGGGSTTHSGNTTTRTNAYGGSATHTAGQGTSASNAYGGWGDHAEGARRTTARTGYGGSATHTAGQGTSASNAYGGSAYHAEGS